MSTRERVRLVLAALLAATVAVSVVRYETARADRADLRSWSQWTRLPGETHIITETICFGEDRVYRTFYGSQGASMAVISGGCK